MHGCENYRVSGNIDVNNSRKNLYQFVNNNLKINKMKSQILLIVAIFFLSNCSNDSQKSENIESPNQFSKVIIQAKVIEYNDLSEEEKESNFTTNVCCYPENWNNGVDCISKEDAFYVKVKINNILLAILTESNAFSMDDLLDENPYLLYGKYHNRWGFWDENGVEICETSKFEGHNYFGVKRDKNVDELIIGPLPKKPKKMKIEISDSKNFPEVTPVFDIN